MASPNHQAPERVTITVAASAVRRPAARTMAAILRDIAEHWPQRLDALTISHAA